MDAAATRIHLDIAWREALDRAAEMRRIVVLGPTDAAKSTFIRALAGATEAQLIDLDPGQKMIGPRARRPWAAWGPKASRR